MGELDDSTDEIRTGMFSAADGDAWRPASVDDTDYTRWYLGAAHGAVRPHTPPAFAPRVTLRGPTQVLALQRHFDGAPSVGALFARASEAAHTECGFARSVVLAVEGGRLTAARTPVLGHAPSEALRQAVLADPVPLAPGSVEAEFVRLAEGGRGELAAGRSALRAAHGLREFALGAVTLDARVLALVVVDRPAPAVTFAERTALQGFTQLIAGALERLVLRQRVASIAAELGHVTATTTAVLRTVIDGDAILPPDADPLAPVPATAALNGPPHSPDARLVFTRRELSIMQQLVRGRSNREIAEQLHISPETVKKYVSRVMRKTGAVNRADAAVRCLAHVSRSS